MTIWFCVKTAQTPSVVAEVVRAFNTFEEEHPTANAPGLSRREKA